MAPCYKDKTFCEAKNCRFFGEACDRSLTDEVKTAAIMWWGNEEAPISVWVSPPSCYQPPAGESDGHQKQLSA